MFFLWFLTLPPQDGFGVHLLSSHLFTLCEQDAPAHHSYSSLTRAVPQAVQGQAAAAQDPLKETHGWRDGQGWTPTLIFFPQIHWYGTMRRVWRLHKLHWEGNSLLDCKIKHFCYIFLFWALPWVVYILALHMKGLFNDVRLNCGPGFTCLFFTDSLPNLDNWVLLELSEMPAKAFCVQAPAYLDKSELWFLWLIYICTIRIKVLSCPRI